MNDENQKSIDLFGIKPIGESIHIATKACLDAAGAFLSRICLPAAEEFGLLLRDKVSHWRAKNALAIVNKAEAKLNVSQEDRVLHAHPRMVISSIDYGSWSEDDTVQEMWGGLLASSCTGDGKDESNLVFINLLSQINSTESTIFRYLCETAPKHKAHAGWIQGNFIITALSELQKLTGIPDMHRIDRELDHLRSLNLIDGGFEANTTLARLMPTPLGLHLYVRCQGFAGSPIEYWKLD